MYAIPPTSYFKRNSHTADFLAFKPDNKATVSQYAITGLLLFSMPFPKHLSHIIIFPAKHQAKIFYTT